MLHGQTKRIGISNRADYNKAFFFQQAPARKVNISIFKHQIISKLLARETYSKHHFAHLVLSEHLHAE